jgi:hypothetical protein
MHQRGKTAQRSRQSVCALHWRLRHRRLRRKGSHVIERNSGGTRASELLARSMTVHLVKTLCNDYNNRHIIAPKICRSRGAQKISVEEAV